MNKYRNVKTVVDGIEFASKLEAKRYAELRLLERAFQIMCLELQPKFTISLNDIPICTYVADFKYFADGDLNNVIVEDVKGMKTPVYRLKKKLVEAQYGIQIMEITK